jgi:hypothetical protein
MNKIGRGYGGDKAKTSFKCAIKTLHRCFFVAESEGG